MTEEKFSGTAKDLFMDYTSFFSVFDDSNPPTFAKFSSPLMIVIHTHVNLEASLIRLIKSGFANPGEFDLDRTSFPMKVRLASALGKIAIEDKAGLLRFNDLRNTLAHTLGTRMDQRRVTIEQVRTVFDSLTPAQKAIASHMPPTDNPVHFLVTVSGILHTHFLLMAIEAS